VVDREEQEEFFAEAAGTRSRLAEERERLVAWRDRLVAERHVLMDERRMLVHARYGVVVAIRQSTIARSKSGS
jgi:hypothetical protein